VTRTLRLALAYDGTGFRGFARQPGLRTVEGVLLAALGAVYDTADHLAVCGRTDTGVHALCQVVSVRADGGPPLEVTARVLTDALPDDVAVLDAREAAAGFHARHDARARAYLYRVRVAPARAPLDARRVLHHPRPLDGAVLDRLATAVRGTHDFGAFTPAETQHEDFVRSVHHARWLAAGDDELAFEIAADRFLRHQVRTLVGTMLACARGERDPAGFEPLLAGAPRAAGGPTAPPWGLYLAGARFAGEPDGTELAALAAARAMFVGFPR
jgi:tRNA pseudouridine38-40 synthase